MYPPTYRGLPLIPTKAAAEELAQLGCDLWLVKEILERGYSCASRDRGPGELEMCLKKKHGLYKVVVAKSYSNALKQNVWVIIHIARFGGEKP